MTTPADEKDNPMHNYHNMHHQRSSDDDGTYIGEDLSHSNSRTNAPALDTRPRSNTHLTVNTEPMETTKSMKSPSQTREQASRLDDDLAMLQIERQISNQEELNRENSNRSVRRTRSRRDDPIDEFDAATNPLHEKAALYKPPENPSTKLSRFVKKVHNSSFLVRYFVYITPLVLIILLPLLLGVFLFPNANVGGVKLVWFCIWLEIVWLTLWAGRVSCSRHLI